MRTAYGLLAAGAAVAAGAIWANSEPPAPTADRDARRGRDAASPPAVVAPSSSAASAATEAQHSARIESRPALRSQVPEITPEPVPPARPASPPASSPRDTPAIEPPAPEPTIEPEIEPEPAEPPAANAEAELDGLFILKEPEPPPHGDEIDDLFVLPAAPSAGDRNER